MSTAARTLGWRGLVVGCGLIAVAAMGHAAEFNLFLKCKGEVQAGDKTRPATLELAMRDNNQTALIQRSNVLPMGERLQYQVSKATYTLLYKLPLPGTQVYSNWLQGGWLVWQPNLKRLATIRMAIDRQSAELEGTLRDFNDESLGELKMQCEPSNLDTAPEPKF